MKQKTSIVISFIIVYMLLKELDLIPRQIKTMTVWQLRKNITLSNELYIVDIIYIFLIFFIILILL